MARVSPVASTTLRLPRQRSLCPLACTSRLSRDSTASRGAALSTGCSMARCPSKPALPTATLHKQAMPQRPEIVLVKDSRQGLATVLQRRQRQRDPDENSTRCCYLSHTRTCVNTPERSVVPVSQPVAIAREPLDQPSRF